MRALPGQAALVVDATGVGRAVLGQMREQGLYPVAVTITGGSAIHFGGLATPSHADGTRPRHLSFLASARKPWSADNSGGVPGPHGEPRAPARRPKTPGLGRSGKMWDEHTTRKPMLLLRLSGLFLLRLAQRALS